MIKRKFNEENIIHKTYKKRRLFIFILFLFTLSFMTIGYARLNSILMFTGYANLKGETGNLEIISVEQTGEAINGTSNGTNFYISESANKDNVVLVAEFDMNFYRTMGSSNSSISYKVVIKNNSLTKRKLSTVNSRPTFSSGNSTLNYSMEGISISTTFISPGDTVTVTLTFSLEKFERYTNYNVYEVFEFDFSKVTDNDFLLDILVETTELEFTTFDDIKPITLEVQNISAQNVTYMIEIDNNNFEVVDANGNEISQFSVSAYTINTDTFYLKISDKNLFESLSDTIGITLVTTSPYILNYNLVHINATVPRSKFLDIIENKTIYSDSNINFTQVSNDSGIYKNSDNGNVTYFYRGNINYNYVSFAGFTWRIIRIDKYGVKLILDDIIDTPSSWGTNPGNNAPLEEAISKILYYNSPVKTIVDNWYDANLSSYSSTINKTLFCMDINYQTMVSSGNAGVTVYYFGSYIRNGTDSTAYTPEFSCDSEHTKEYNIGLITGDEVAFAGGVFNTANTNFYLYNSKITDTWWTMSPSYYDSSLGTVGMLLVTGSNGRFNDWISQATIQYSSYIRPVITLDTNKLNGGNGTQGDMFTFSS